MIRPGIGIVLGVVGLACASSVAFAQDKSQFPYQALILNENVTVRSGPGEVHYSTDRLGQGDAVEVYQHAEGGWCGIRPPAGSFSLVLASTVELLDSNVGMMKSAEGAVAWIGTRLGRVDHQHWQIKLARGERVTIQGEVSWPSPDGHSASWYQISPPAGELRWIHKSDLQLATGLTELPEPINAGKTISAEFNQRANLEADRGFSQNDVAQVGTHSVVEPMLGVNNSRSVQTTEFAQQTSVGDFAQFENNAVSVSGNAEAANPLLQSSFQNRQQTSNIGSNFYRPNDDFTQGLVIEGKDVAMKIGGYVKLDLIQDFNAIDCTDQFDVSSIPVGAAKRTNNRMHVRQTRLNFDTRWKTKCGIIRSFVEGDFFSDGDNFRLRHAYGKLGRFLGGQTYTTFANIDASPATLDFEGSISAISPRRALVRWTQPIFTDDLNLAVALEDSSTAIELPPGSTTTGDTRTVSPDLVARLRRTRPGGNLQIAGIARILGFQPTGESVKTSNAWGLNFSQVQELSPDDKIYWQINYGDGIASLLGGLPDITPVGTDSAGLLGYFGWMIGSTHDWNSKLSSNFTFAESHFQNTSGQPSTDINNLTYVAANLIWTPLERFEVGVEYLYGKREDISGENGIANRLQVAFFYYLP